MPFLKTNQEKKDKKREAETRPSLNRFLSY